MALRTPSALAAALLSLAACGGKADGAKAGRPVSVHTAVAVEKSAPIEVHAVGRIVSNRSVALRPQVSGVLLAARFTEGQRVAQGQVLLEIDPRPYQAALAEARARRDQERVRADNARAETARLAELAGRGAEVTVCSACCRFRGLGKDDLVEGAEIGGMGALARMIDECDRVLTLGA